MKTVNKKEGVVRFSVSTAKALMCQFDQLRKSQGYKNRPLAVADMIRDRLVEHRQVGASMTLPGP